MGRACLSPPVDCCDGRIVAYTAGFRSRCRARRQDARQGRGDAAGGSASLVYFVKLRWTCSALNLNAVGGWFLVLLFVWFIS